MKKVAVIGAGAWGTALAKIASDNGAAVTLWGRNRDLLDSIQRLGENSQYLPGVSLPSTWRLESDLFAACQSADLIVMAVPSRGFREVLEKMPSFSGAVVTVTKGIEDESGLTMSGVLGSVLTQSIPVALSGPNIAREVALGMPAASVAASADLEAAEKVQQALHRPTFRVYSSSDILGVELGGALKNVIAIAAGVCDGMGFGDNSKSALLTRGISEIRRLGVAAGAKAETFTGLSGLGDLTVTCFAAASRNRSFGERLGRGEIADEVLSSSRSVVEGVPTARSAFHLARRLEVETPIIDEVYAMLHEGKAVKIALESLLGRVSKAED